MTKPVYQLFVDTGGTFTDCIAIDANGNESRLKVLSNSSLRGSISQIIAPCEFIIHQSWNLTKDIIRGFAFKLLGDDYGSLKVTSFDPSTNHLTLTTSLSSEQLKEGVNFEITSFEEAPILGARLLTHTALDEEFPDLILKLGSTKGTNVV